MVTLADGFLPKVSGTPTAGSVEKRFCAVALERCARGCARDGGTDGLRRDADCLPVFSRCPDRSLREPRDSLETAARAAQESCASKDLALDCDTGMAIRLERLRRHRCVSGAGCG